MEPIIIKPTYNFEGRGLLGSLERARADIIKKFFGADRVYDHGEWNVLEDDGKSLYFFVRDGENIDDFYSLSRKKPIHYPYTVVAGYEVPGTGKNTGDFKRLPTVGVRTTDPRQRIRIKELLKDASKGHINFWNNGNQYYKSRIYENLQEARKHIDDNDIDSARKSVDEAKDHAKKGKLLIMSCRLKPLEEALQ